MKADLVVRGNETYTSKLSDDDLDATLNMLIEDAPEGMVDNLFMHFLREKHRRFMKTLEDEKS